MPHVVSRDIEARELRGWDVIKKVDRDTMRVFVGRQVVSAEVKTKLVHLRIVVADTGEPVVGPEIRTVPLDAKLTVEREELTKDEEIQDAREYVTRWINSSMGSDLNKADSVRASLQRKLGASYLGWSHALIDYLEIQTRVQIWDSVMKRYEQETALDLVGALRNTIDDIVGDVLWERFDIQSSNVKLIAALESHELSARVRWAREAKLRLDALDSIK